MLKVKYTCLECEDAITDPLCVSCFQNQFLLLIKEKDVSQETKNEMRNEMALVMASIKPFSFTDFRCVICKNKMNEICSHCLMKQTSEVMEKYFSEAETELLFNFKTHEFGIRRAQ